MGAIAAVQTLLSFHVRKSNATERNDAGQVDIDRVLQGSRLLEIPSQSLGRFTFAGPRRTLYLLNRFKIQMFGPEPALGLCDRSAGDCNVDAPMLLIGLLE